MKTFLVYPIGVQPYFKLQSDPALGPCLVLGEAGRGRRFVKIKLDRQRPPAVVEIDGGPAIEDAGLVQFEAGGATRHAFTAPAPGDRRFLIRFYTGRAYVRHTSGRVFQLRGNPVKVAEGYGAFGDAGRLGTWDDVLFIASPGDAFEVRPSGRNPAFVVEITDAGPKIFEDAGAWKSAQDTPKNVVAL
jgi:hypothetical protein